MNFTYYANSGRPVTETYPDEYTTYPADMQITVKAGSNKSKLAVNKQWSGEFLFKMISHHTHISMDDLKLIIRGKVHTAESVSAALSSNTVVMVLGTPIANSTGVDERDIECLMKQMNVDRNEAITSLKKTRSLVDSIVNIGNS